jgi:hypothetical protein
VKHRVIQDGALGIGLTLGVGEGEKLARISWSDGSCHVDAAALSLGRWVPAPDCAPFDQLPPIPVVCRATALAVGAWIKEDVMSAVEGLP